MDERLSVQGLPRAAVLKLWGWAQTFVSLLLFFKVLSDLNILLILKLNGINSHKIFLGGAEFTNVFFNVKFCLTATHSFWTEKDWFNFQG